MSWGDGGKSGGNWDYGRGGGRGEGWGRRFDDRSRQDDRPQEHYHSLEGAVGSLGTEPILRVQIDAVVFLQIMKHCRQHAPYPVTGQLLGLDVGDTLQVTHCFGYYQKSGADESQDHTEDGEQYQLDTQRCLRKVNVDSNIVGWYQTTHLGQFFSSTAIKTQNSFQTEIPRSVLLVYDSLQSSIGKPAFKAWQLKPEFMTMYADTSEVGRMAMAEFPSDQMFVEIPIAFHNSALVEAFLVDWCISDPISTTSQVEILDVENQAFLEKNVQLLMGALQDLADEQNRVMMFERQAGRKGDMQQKGGRDRFNRNMTQPRQLDTMILSQQIKTFCKALNSFTTDSFGKVYLVANKPSGGAE